MKVSSIILIKSLIKTHPLLKLINRVLIDLPIPSSLFYWWNFGSLAALSLIIQLISGLFLSMHYCRDISLAFFRVTQIIHDVNLGWLVRLIHINGARLFFIMLYIHVGRGLYYISWKNHMTWIIGVSILIITIGVSFLGYVLPWGQISFWGATVITNLGSSIPYIGTELVLWIWGGPSVRNATLNRFFRLHFILPFVILALVIVHILFLHEETSSNPLGLSSTNEKISFHPYYSIKDIFGVIIALFLFFSFIILFPYALGDCENFIKANPLVTPVHIQPEWYFLFAYAILRSVPNKLGGVICLLISLVILYFLPLIYTSKLKGITHYPINQFLFWSFIRIFFILTWIGICVVEQPFLIIGQVTRFLYFLYFFLKFYLLFLWDQLL